METITRKSEDENGGNHNQDRVSLIVREVEIQAKLEEHVHDEEPSTTSTTARQKKQYRKTGLPWDLQ